MYAINSAEFAEESNKFHDSVPLAPPTPAIAASNLDVLVSGWK